MEVTTTGKFSRWFNEETLPIIFSVVSGVAVLLSFLGVFAEILPFDIAWVAIILCGFPILKGAVVGLVTEFDIKADVLVSIALVASVIIGEAFAAGEIAFIMSIGTILEERTTRKAQQGIQKLMDLSPQTARRVVDGVESIIDAEEIQAGDILRVLPGETIAVDGVILSGETSINQAVMTGESLPVDKGVGDDVLSGTTNQFGAFDMRATKVGKDSSLQRMIKLVEEADAAKSPIVRITDKWSTWIVVMALSAAVLTWLATGEIIRAVTILVVFCPCSLVLATPTAIMAAVGNATRFGILIRTGDALERLAKVSCVAFDKTGTLTHGKPQVVAVELFLPELSVEEFLSLTATAERRSEHPLGKAIVQYAKEKQVEMTEPENFQMIPGKGVVAGINNRQVLAGNRSLLEMNGVEADEAARKKAAYYEDTGCTGMFVVVDNQLAGFIALADTLRGNIADVIKRISATGVRPVLLTGDNENAAAAISRQAGITEVWSGLLPEDKVEIIDKLQQANGQRLCMVGDGVNDAPALKTAFVGVAMGGVGSDIAVDAADAVLVRDDIDKLPHLLKLAARTLSTIKAGIILSVSINLTAVVLAALGVIGPILGALVHNVGSVFVVLLSARLLGMKEM